MSHTPTQASRRHTFRLGPASWQYERRTTVVLCLSILAIVGFSVATLTFPGAGVNTAESFRVLTFRGETFPTTVVTQWRLPRTVAAIVLGAALALAGALMQVITRNPLGSPDILGFNTGAYTGVILAVTAGYSSFLDNAIAAFLGGLITAGIVMFFAFRKHTNGLRLILVGIGVSMMLSAFNKWLILRGDLETSMSAAAWGAGSLNGLRWEQVFYANIMLITLIVAAVGLRRHVDALRLGTDTAESIGVPTARYRRLTVFVAVSLTATATALAGPISFIALAAPHITRMLTRSVRLPLLSTAAMGSVLLLASDIAAQRLFDPVQLPVGLVTVSIGGAYLLWLMRATSPKRS